MRELPNYLEYHLTNPENTFGACRFIRLYWKVINVKLNCMGEICPVPALKVQSVIKKLKPGEVIEVIVDHSCAVGNIIELLDGKLYRHVVTEVANGIWEIKIEMLELP